MQLSTKELCEGFSKLPTGNVADAMDELGLCRSVITGISCVGPLQHTAAGIALTIQQVERGASSEGGNLAQHGRIIDEQTTSDKIIVISTNGLCRISTGGAIQMAIAKSKGANGYLTDGAIRDIEEIQALDFPVFAAAASPLKSSLDIETIGVNVPVMINGTQIKPGDVIVMDHTGIVVVPYKLAQEVLEKAVSIQAREERLKHYLNQGVSLSEARKLSKKEEE